MPAPKSPGGQTDGHKTSSVRLSVSEAAARLDSTPRSVRRWISEGRLDAEPDPNGRGRLLSLESVEHLKSERDAEATRTSGRTDNRTQNPVRPAVREPGDESETNLSPGRGRGEMIEQLRGEVEFLRARNAELNAVVMQQARALSSMGTAREISALESAPEQSKTSVDRPEFPEPPEPPARRPEREERRFPAKARPLWQVVLGIRPKDLNR